MIISHYDSERGNQNKAVTGAIPTISKLMYSHFESLKIATHIDLIKNLVSEKQSKFEYKTNLFRTNVKRFTTQEMKRPI